MNLALHLLGFGLRKVLPRMDGVAQTARLKNTLLAALADLLLSAPTLAQDAPELGVDDDAPALTIAKWVKGNAVDSFAKDSVSMIEFWATW